jgi:hypothetical protein
MSLDRLINLVKKTGDRLVVHDSITEQDVVLMDIDSYEDLLFSAETDRGQMNEAELLDQINRDIAIWRAKRSVDDESYDDVDEADDFFTSTPPVVSPVEEESSSSPSAEPHESLSEVGENEPIYAPVGEEVAPEAPMPRPRVSAHSPWKSAGQILENRLAAKPASPENTNNSLEYKENTTPNEWKEEPLGGDEPVFYEEPIG